MKMRELAERTGMPHETVRKYAVRVLGPHAGKTAREMTHEEAWKLYLYTWIMRHRVFPVDDVPYVVDSLFMLSRRNRGKTYYEYRDGPFTATYDAAKLRRIFDRQTKGLT